MKEITQTLSNMKVELMNEKTDKFKLTKMNIPSKNVRLCLFIAVLLSSMLGAQIYNISLNKLALIPLEIIFIFKYCIKKKISLTTNQRLLLLLYLEWIVSSLIGIIYSAVINSSVLFNKNISQIIQIIIIYVPLTIGTWEYSKKYNIKAYFEKYVVIVARIQASWAIMQFLLYYIVHFDLNYFVFSSLFGGILGGGQSWTRFSNLSTSTNGIMLRVSGLNRDAAFFGLVLFVGFIFEKQVLWKLIYLFCTAISFSRSTMVTILFIMIFKSLIIIKPTKGKLRNPKRILKYCTIICMAIFSFIIIYSRNEFIKNSMHRLLERFSTITTGGDGTGRHMGYFSAAVNVWAFYVPLILKLFGLGGTVGGTLLSVYSYTVKTLDLSEASLVWAIESDPPNLLLGVGIIGFILYYLFSIKCAINNKKDKSIMILIFAILIFGLMYNVAINTYSQLIYIYLYCMSNEKVRTKNE